ncbi:hypothetical protein [Gramella sp. KN1008]|uniref:hypothetical protein n=1 Tax=Gramella sp. KN1008 TaxID=2529298 RepID=UPI00103BA98B|nr:hypothetical protein [Gramella sp. KN1008]TBW27841.1 hypothetical protein EZJ28_08855 [Gramella sp. KN1008]
MFISLGGTAQRMTREVIDATRINTIHINTDEVFRIKLRATSTSTISIQTRSEGEYYNDITLESSIKADRFELTSRYPEILTGGYDKLSAHKVFSLEIEMEIPEGMEVVIRSNLASVMATGNYKAFYTDLKQGHCELLSFSGQAVVNTYSGDILIETGTGLIEAHSRNGEVIVPEFLPGRNPLKLTSIDGDIMVRKN